MATNSLQAESVSANPVDETFTLVCQMEDHLCAARDLMMGVMLIACELGDAEGTAIDRIASAARDRVKAAQDLRTRLFRVTHP